MPDADPTDPFEIGRRLGREDALQHPLTEEQARKIRVLLRTGTEPSPSDATSGRAAGLVEDGLVPTSQSS